MAKITLDLTGRVLKAVWISVFDCQLCHAVTGVCQHHFSYADDESRKGFPNK